VQFMQVKTSLLKRTGRRMIGDRTEEVAQKGGPGVERTFAAPPGLVLGADGTEPCGLGLNCGAPLAPRGVEAEKLRGICRRSDVLAR
jgi:hypothetical protein